MIPDRGRSNRLNPRLHRDTVLTHPNTFETRAAVTLNFIAPLEGSEFRIGLNGPSN